MNLIHDLLSLPEVPVAHLGDSDFAASIAAPGRLPGPDSGNAVDPTGSREADSATPTSGLPEQGSKGGDADRSDDGERSGPAGSNSSELANEEHRQAIIRTELTTDFGEEPEPLAPGDDGMEL